MSLIQSLRTSASELTAYFILLLLSATLGPFLFGYNLAELNAPQDVIICHKKSITVAKMSLPQCIPMNPTQLGLVASIFTVGGLFGALASGPASNKYGRLRVMRIGAILTVVGPIALTLAPSIAIMAIGRFICGLGAGAALVVVPIYISEIAPPRQKGFFGAFTQIMTNGGILTTQILGYFLSHDQMWRLILAIAGFIAVVQLCGLFVAVDSPSWQAANGEPKIARANLQKIRGDGADLAEETKHWTSQSEGEDLDEYDALIVHEQHTIDASTPAERHSNRQKATVGTFEVLAQPQNRHATCVVMMVLAAQQLCGINSIVMYGVSLLSGLLQAQSALLNIFVSLLNVILTTVGAPLIDILGRKPCLLGSIGGMGTASLLLGIGIRSAIPLLSTISVLVFVGSFALGLGPIPFMLSSELVGPEAVSATQSWGLAVNWITTFLVAQFFPILNQSLGKGVVYFVFAGSAAFFFVLVLLLLPETKGKKSADEVWGRESRAE